MIPFSCRTRDTLMRLLHLLQHLAARIGLLLNGSKCQLISIHSSLPVSVSLAVTLDNPCDRPFRAQFFGLESNPNSLDVPFPPLSSAKYLGSFIPDVSFRCSQASHAFNCLDPFFRHALISLRRKLQVYSKIVQSILLRDSELQVYSPAQMTRLDSLQYIFLEIKSPYYHRVLNPTDALVLTIQLHILLFLH